jgi:hypothetical protein
MIMAAFVGMLPSQLAMPNSRNAPVTINPNNRSQDSMRCGWCAQFSSVPPATTTPPTCRAQSISARMAVYTDSVISMPRNATPSSDMVDMLEGCR